MERLTYMILVWAITSRWSLHLRHHLRAYRVVHRRRVRQARQCQVHLHQA